MKRWIVLSIVLLLALPGLADGWQEGSSEFELFAGAHLGDTFTLSTSEGNDLQMELDDSMMLGLRGSYFFFDNISMEVTIAGTQAQTWEGQDFNIYYFQGNLTYQFGHAAFSPFFTIGMGMAMLDHPTVDSDWHWRQKTDSEFAWNMGGGFKIYFGQDFAFRTDVRAYWTRTSEEDYWDDDCWDDDHDCDYWQDSLNATEISAGFVFRF